jgi:hypothetical protein
MMNQDWDIKPRSKVCQKCQAPFADQKPYFTRLDFTKDGYQRMDSCEDCWASVDAKAGSHSAWKGIFRVPPPEPERGIKRETAESLLRSLMEDNDGSKRNTIYILAVMLERQRLLVDKETKVDKNGSRTLVDEHRKTGEVFVIPDPQLRLDQLDHVQQEVSLLLAGSEAPQVAANGGEAPAAPPAADAAES